jgi:hypothetical protein
MNTPLAERQKLIEAVSALPDEALAELASFVDYLRYKSAQSPEKKQGSSFLLSIAGLGASGEQDLSERDEEVLHQEIDPIQGWSLRPNNSV